jgi:phage terminase large subunit GpA-like protein
MLTLHPTTADPDRHRIARRSTVRIPNGRGQLYRLAARALRPRPLLRVSEWSDGHRVLTSKGSGEPGPWRTARTPYLREILDHLSTQSPVQRVVMRFAAQLGKTEVGLNWIGYVMHHAPGPMLVVLPTLEVRKRWVRQRLDPMMQSTPAISAIFDARSKRDPGNAEDIKDFPGGMLVLGGANSPASLSSMPIQYVLCDEVDRFPWEAGAEGDPLGLVDERTKTFPRRKVLLVSTPTVAGLSRIDDEFGASDQRRYQVPCPHCGEHQVLTWRNADGELSLHRNDATGAVYYVCGHCAERIDEHHKTDMLAAGRWVAEHPERPVKGYALNGLYSPIGLGFTWAELWEKWQEAQGDTSRLKRFINTTLGEAWEEQGDSLDPLHLMARLEDYPDTLPAGIRTVGVDVQKDRLELTAVDWGVGEEAWVQDHIILPGDTALEDVWEDLADELVGLKPAAVAVDSGYNTDQVHAFCDGRSWVFAIKGMPGTGRPVVEDQRRRRQRLRHRRRKSAEIWMVGVDNAKALIYARARLPEPGPGYLHFPRAPAFDDEYFQQLAAEKLITKVRNTRAYAEWVKTRSRNEALDCFIYALAALRITGIDPADRTPEAQAAALANSSKTPKQPPRKSWLNKTEQWIR